MMNRWEFDIGFYLYWGMKNDTNIYIIASMDLKVKNKVNFKTSLCKLAISI